MLRAACDFDFGPEILRYRQRLTRPCKERKDGAPTVLGEEAESKAISQGEPPTSHSFPNHFRFPPLRKVAQERGSHFRYTIGGVKVWATRPRFGMTNT